MSHIQFDTMPGVPAKNALLQEAGLLAQPAQSASFREHLQRLQSHGSDAGDEQAPAAPDAPVPRVDNTPSRQRSEAPRGAGSSDAEDRGERPSAPTAPLDATDDASKSDMAEAADPHEAASAPAGDNGKSVESRRETDKGKKRRADAAAHPQGEPGAAAHANPLQPGAPGGNGEPQNNPANLPKADETQTGSVAAPPTAQPDTGGAKVARNVRAKGATGKSAGNAEAASGAPAGEGGSTSPAQEATGDKSRAAKAARAKSAAANGQAPGEETPAVSAGQQTAQVGHRQQAEPETAATDGPRRTPGRDRHAEKKAAAPAGDNQALPDRPVPAQPPSTAEAAVKSETVQAAAAALASAAEDTVKAVGETPKPAASENRIGQAGDAARESTNAPAQSATPTSDAKADESSPLDRVRFVQRVANAFQAMGGRDGAVRLRLSPPELGSLRIEIAVRNGALNARVEADNPTTRNLLLDNLPALRERLAQQDIKIDQFHVDLMNRSPGDAAGQTPSQAQSQGQGGGYRAPQGLVPQGAERQAAAAPRLLRRPGEGNHLDVVI